MMQTWKKRISRCLTVVLTLSLLLCALTPAVAVEYGAELNPEEKTYTQMFSDVPEKHWAFQYIGEMVERGAISGYPDGKFYPGKIVTREEFAKIMVVAAGLTATPAETSSYADVPLKRWSSPFIETAKPYMTAYRSGGQLYFKPSDGALREDMAVAVVMLKGYDTRLADLSMITTMFSDVDAISTSAQPYVALAVENGIISGYNDGTFRGQATITRAEAAAILWRAFQYGSDSKVMPGEEGNVTPQPVTTTTPKPTVTQKPIDTMPPEPEKEIKPFVAETLTKASISDTAMLVTMDDDSDLIYYDEDEKAIFSLNAATGEKEVLLDVLSATGTDDSGITYEGLTVNQVFWDDVASRLLVDGTFQSAKTEDGWETGNQAYSAIFTLENGSMEKTFDRPDFYGYRGISLALSDGSYVVKDIYYNLYITDFAGSEDWMGEKKWYGGSSIQEALNNKNIYVIERNGSIWRFDYGTKKWISVADSSDSGAADYQNSCFYTWTQNMIQIVRPSDGVHQTKLNPAEDVEVLDMRALPTYHDNLFVTADEQYLFYDSSAKAIRVIRANPEAN